MKRFILCCFKDEEKPTEIEQKTTNLDSELTIIDKLNQVKEIMRKSVEESKKNRVAIRRKPEVIVGIEQIPVYEYDKGQLRDKNECREMIFTE